MRKPYERGVITQVRTYVIFDYIVVEILSKTSAIFTDFEL